MRPLLILLALTAALACSPRRLAESALLRNHFILAHDLPYGRADRARLDVYRPRSRNGPAPVIVFLYGSRWQHGSKDEYRLLGEAITERGLVAVVPDYRLYPEVRFPAWITDAAGAVRWVRDNIGRYGGDPSRIFVAGHSAGAHTAALLGLDERYLRAAGVPSGAVSGFISLAGPVATRWTDMDVQTLMGPAESWPLTYPASHVDGTEPPLLLLHGERDRTVAVENATGLASRVRERGGCATAITYRRLDHVGIVIALSVPRLEIAPVLDDLLAFVLDPTTACPDAARITSPTSPWPEKP